MQCVNCHFENMPGTALCVRCGTSLNLATMAIDVYPPRAGKRRKAIRRWLPLGRTYYPLRNALAASRQTVAAAIAAGLNIHLPAKGDVARMIVPGWAHMHLGHRDRGRAFLFGWLATLVVGVLTFGTTIGAIALGLAFATHAASILDLLMQVNQTSARTLVLVTTLVFVALLAIYIPAGRAASQFISSRQLLQTTEPFVSGDVVLFSPRAYDTALPAPGDIVLYRNRSFRTAVQDYAFRDAINRIEGEWVDRVVAGPNSTVKWEKGKLFVNGKSSPFLPLNPANLPPSLEIIVPSNACCVLPTTNPYFRESNSAEVFQSNCIVPRSLLVGKVIVRNYPVWRWWWVR